MSQSIANAFIGPVTFVFGQPVTRNVCPLKNMKQHVLGYVKVTSPFNEGVSLPNAVEV